MNSEENILVVDTELFHQVGWFQGFTAETEKYQKTLLASDNIKFLKRGLAEKDPRYKQIIPYMLFCWTNSDGKCFLFTYIRGKGQGEVRLHRKMSVGIGGHINDSDLSSGSGDLYRQGMFREFKEEVRVESAWTERCVGLINDDQTEVGRVHLGVVHRFDLTEPKMTANEVDLLEAGFRSVDDLLSEPEDAFETWSRISLNALF